MKAGILLCREWNKIDGVHTPTTHYKEEKAHTLYVLDNVLDFTSDKLINIFEEWRDNPPSKEILEDFKKVVNTASYGFYDSRNSTVSRFLINWFNYRFRLTIITWFIYYGLDLKAIYLKSYYDIENNLVKTGTTVIQDLEEDISIKEGILTILKEIKPLDFPKIEEIEEKEERGKKYVAILWLIHQYKLKYFIKIDSYYSKWERNSTPEKIASDIGETAFHNIINKIFNCPLSLIKMMEDWERETPSEEMLEDFRDLLNYWSECTTLPYVCDVVSYVHSKELILKFFTLARKFGLDTDKIYDFNEKKGNLIEIIKYRLHHIVCFRDALLRVKSGQIIGRAVKSAMNDEFVMTKLRYNIEKRRFEKMLEEKKEE